MICPPNVQKGVFTVAAIDNIDHNPTSNTSKEAFHGTAMSLFQIGSQHKPGVPREKLSCEDDGTEGLPKSYTFVPPLDDDIKKALMPRTLPVSIPENLHIFKKSLSEEQEWLNHFVQSQAQGSCKKVSWAGYHASQPRNANCSKGILPATKVVLPLFYEKAHSPSMVKHGLEKITEAIQKANPGQIPVIAMDQPLYSMAKHLQWTYTSLSEENIVIMLGGMHTEMAMLSTIGDILQGSGWVTALTQAQVVGSGVAQNISKGSPLMKARYCHQVTLAALWKLRKEAEEETLQLLDDENAWLSEMKAKSATFYSWDLVMQMEVILLLFVRAHRKENF